MKVQAEHPYEPCPVSCPCWPARGGPELYLSTARVPRPPTIHTIYDIHTAPVASQHHTTDGCALSSCPESDITRTVFYFRLNAPDLCWRQERPHNRKNGRRGPSAAAIPAGHRQYAVKIAENVLHNYGTFNCMCCGNPAYICRRHHHFQWIFS